MCSFTQMDEKMAVKWICLKNLCSNIAIPHTHMHIVFVLIRFVEVPLDNLLQTHLKPEFRIPHLYSKIDISNVLPLYNFTPIL